MGMNYNPFRMYGAWLGGLFAVGLFMICDYADFVGITSCGINSFLDKITFIFHKTIFPFSIFILTGSIMLNFFVGFLIGWIVHSIFRAVKN